MFTLDSRPRQDSYILRHDLFRDATPAQAAKLAATLAAGASAMLQTTFNSYSIGTFIAHDPPRMLWHHAQHLATVTRLARGYSHKRSHQLLYFLDSQELIRHKGQHFKSMRQGNENA